MFLSSTALYEVFAWFLLRHLILAGFYRVPPQFTGFYRVLPSFHRPYRLVQSSKPNMNRFRHGLLGFCCAAMESHWDGLGFHQFLTGPYRV